MGNSDSGKKSSENLHENHRARLREKFMADAESLSEHEVLELLLFYALPRVNTNDTAHRLINEFGSISEVLSAPTDLLESVKGIGENAAVFLSTIGLLIKKYYSPLVSDREEKFSFGTYKKPLIDLFATFDKEVFIMIFLDENHKVKAKKTITGHHKDKVELDMRDITEAVVSYKPSYVIIAHNHLSGNPHPSEADDNATSKINMICSLNGAELVDHLIFSDDKTYSYRFESRLDLIKERTKSVLS